ncbi:MAG TPA: GIY-YIG nuclease family protein [Patescibacteria group bacterium]
MYVVYIIQSQSTKKIYIGFTVNLKRRLLQHNSNESYSTKNKGPWKLIYCEVYRNRDDAKNREDRLKYYGRALGQLKRRIVKSLL